MRYTAKALIKLQEKAAGEITKIISERSVRPDTALRALQVRALSDIFSALVAITAQLERIAPPAPGESEKRGE